MLLHPNRTSTAGRIFSNRRARLWGASLHPMVGMALVVSACEDIDRLEADVCGNSVVEPPRENCDRQADPALGANLVCGPPDGTPRACQYLCAGNAACPRGWACGEDQICRFPSGRLSADDEPTLILRADQIALGALSGNDEEQLMARLDGDLFFIDLTSDEDASLFQMSVPDWRSAFLLADIEENPPWVVLATSLGAGSIQAGLAFHALKPQRDRLVAATVEQPQLLRVSTAPPLTSESVQVLSVPNLALNDGTEVPLYVIVAKEPPELQFSLSDDQGRLLPAFFRFPLPAVDAMPLRPKVVEGDRGSQPTVEIALGFLKDPNVAVLDISCILRNEALCAPTTQRISLPLALEPAGFDLVDLDSDSDADLVAYVENKSVAVAIREAGIFGPTRIDPRFDSLVAVPAGVRDGCGGARLVLASQDLNKDGVSDFVTEHAVFLSEKSSPTTYIYKPAFHRIRGDAWAEAVIGDFDRDGRADVVASTRSLSSTCAATSLEFLRGSVEGSFNASLLGNVSLPSKLNVGDFDGDGISDVVVIEQAPDERDLVSVFYGETKESLEDKASVGTFPDVTDLEAHIDPNPLALNPDRTTDILIVSKDDGTTTSLVRGDATRTLLSPVVLPGRINLDQSGTAIALGAGRLFNEEDTDLVFVGAENLWLFEGSLLQEAPKAHVFALGSLPAAFQTLRAPCAHIAISSLRASGGNLLVAIDGFPSATASLLPPATLEACRTGPSQLVIAQASKDDDKIAWHAGAIVLSESGRVPTKILLMDLDQNGTDDLVVLFSLSARGSSIAETGSLSIYWNISLDPAADQARFEKQTKPLEDEDVLAITALNLDKDPEPEVAVFTRSGLYAVDHANGTDSVRTVSLGEEADFENPASPVHLVSGDVTGDDLEDLVLLLGEALFVIPMEASD